VRALLRRFIDAHGQTLVNLFVFMCLGHYVINRATDEWIRWVREGRLDFVEVAFFLNNCILLTLVLVRRQHVAMDGRFSHQAVALAAFFSGILFREAGTPHPALLAAARTVTSFAIALSAASLVSLGRSFGILIAHRKIQTGGLYRVVRHPMYFTDILWRLGIVLKNPLAYNIFVFLGASACYVYRALLEERFLSQQPEYRDYMERVRYRFIRGIF